MTAQFDTANPHARPAAPVTTKSPMPFDRRRWGRAVACRAVVAVTLAIMLTACIGWDPPHGELYLHNRSDQPVYVYLEDAGGEESLMAGPIEPGAEEEFSVLPRGRECPGAGTFVLRDEAGAALARRDNKVDPVCDGEPWVWPPEGA